VKEAGVHRGVALPPTSEESREDGTPVNEVAVASRMCQITEVTNDKYARIPTVRQQFQILYTMVAFLVLGLSAACESPPPKVVEPAEKSPSTQELRADEMSAGFSGLEAYRQLEELREVAGGTAGLERTREYFRSELRSRNIEFREMPVRHQGPESADMIHITAVIPGKSNDVLFLAAHYGGSNEVESDRIGSDPPQEFAPSASGDLSGPALLLELARALRQTNTLEYTVWLAFIDGGAAKAPIMVGTRSLVDELIRTGDFSRIRLAVLFGNVADRDLEIARDIESPRMYREIFWSAADRLDYRDVFSPESSFARALTGQPIFSQEKLRASVAIASGSWRSPGTPPDESAQSAQSLAAVGNVTIEALDVFAAKFQRIDRFQQSPLMAGREVPAAAESSISVR
jgi:hypothetical protein